MNNHGLKPKRPKPSSRPPSHLPLTVTNLHPFHGSIQKARESASSLRDKREDFRQNLREFQPELDNLSLQMVKNGRFHHSATAIALYLSRYPVSAAHDKKFGYIYMNGTEILAFGVFRGLDNRRYGFIIPIKAKSSKIHEMAKYVIKEFKLAGAYVRFLGVAEFGPLLNPMFGFVPAKERPWHPDAPEEDETLNNALIHIPRVIKSVERGKGLKHIRQCTNRIRRLFEDTNSRFTLVRIRSQDHISEAEKIVRMHLGAIDRRGKLVSSSPEDYEGILQPEILSLRSVRAFLGCINDLPVSVLIGDTTGEHSAGLYAAITLRDEAYISKAIPSYDTSHHPRLSALSTYVIFTYLKELNAEGIHHLDLGGSEHADLNKWKRHLGAKARPTYWVFLSEESVTK